MITGIVNADFEATLRLTVRGANGQARKIRAIVDSGFNGYLILPPNVIAELGLVLEGQVSVTLADGSEILADSYRGIVIWDRRRRLIPVDEANTTPLIGTALLADFALKVDFRPSGKVTIKRLPRR
jgi:clan AA aspartic protease